MANRRARNPRSRATTAVGPAGDKVKYVLAKQQIVGQVADPAGTYSNYALVSGTPEDLAIDFAILSTTADEALIKIWGPKGVMPATPLFRVRMTWRVAKGLADALQIQIAKMESGELFRPVEADDHEEDNGDEGFSDQGTEHEPNVPNSD